MPRLNEIRGGYELGYKSGNRRQWLACPDCGKERWVTLGKGQPLYRYCKKCANTRRIAENHPRWKGGKRITSKYVEVRLRPDSPFYSMAHRGYVYEHRLIMAQHLGRCLRKEEVVHHLNGIKTDNRLQNLGLVSPNSHNRQSLIQQLQHRIRDLEAKLAQQNLFDG